MDGKQAWGIHYNVHSLYGFSEMEPTMKFVLFYWFLTTFRFILNV